MGLLPLHHVKNIIDYSGTMLLYGDVGTVPYGNAPHDTLQNWTYRTGESRGNNRNDGKSGTGGIVSRYRFNAETMDRQLSERILSAEGGLCDFALRCEDWSVHEKAQKAQRTGFEGWSLRDIRHDARHRGKDGARQVVREICHRAARGLFSQLLPSVWMFGEERWLRKTGWCSGHKRKHRTVNRSASAPDSANGTEAYQSWDTAAVYRRNTEAGIGETIKMRFPTPSMAKVPFPVSLPLMLFYERYRTTASCQTWSCFKCRLNSPSHYFCRLAVLQRQFNDCFT